MGKELTWLEAKQKLTRIVDPECSLHLDPTDKILKLRNKKTDRLYDFPALPPEAEAWRNDPKNRELFKAMHTAPHLRAKKGKEALAGLTGWQNYAMANVDPCHRFSATQSVPGTPSTGGASLLSYWLGLNLTNGSNPYLMQPALITTSGSSVWTLLSEVVDFSNNTVYADSSGGTISPGSSAYPLVVWNGPTAGWYIGFWGQSTGITLTGMTGAGVGPELVKEVHAYNVCSDINPYSGGLASCQFSNMIIGDGNGYDVTSTAQWNGYGSGSCNEWTNLNNANYGTITLNN